MQKKLREDQEHGVQQLAAKASRGVRKLLYVAPTGSGKGPTLATIAYRFSNKQKKKVVICVHRIELLEQVRHTLFEWYGITAAKVTADVKQVPNSMIYVAMVETANNRLKNNPKYFGDNVGMFIIDEGHRGEFEKMYGHFPSSIIISFTATPISSRKDFPLNKSFEDIVVGPQIPELIAAGRLTRNVTIDVQNITRNKAWIKMGEFSDEIVGRVLSAPKHIGNCIAAYKAHSRGKKTIVFNSSIEHSKKVTAAFFKEGYNAKHVDGTTHPDARKEIFRWFKLTDDAVLCNVGIATTGFDEPSIQTVMVNRLTTSVTLFLQMCGRGGRLFPDKDKFLILDLGGNAETLGDWSIERDWAGIFWNPDKALPGMFESPSKPCKKCRVIIPAASKTCPHCGAVVVAMPKTGNYAAAARRNLAPFKIDMKELVARMQEMEYKKYYPVMQAKTNMMFHVKTVWKVKPGQLDDVLAARIIAQFQLYVEEFCTMTKEPYTPWWKIKPNEWIREDLKKIFKWES